MADETLEHSDDVTAHGDTDGQDDPVSKVTDDEEATTESGSGDPLSAHTVNSTDTTDTPVSHTTSDTTESAASHTTSET